MLNLADMQPFWMVWGIGRSGPTYQHESEASALAEAERLAKQFPGTVFTVLEASHVVARREVDVHRLGQAALGPRRCLDCDTPF